MFRIAELLNISYGAHALYSATTWGIFDFIRENGALSLESLSEKSKVNSRVLKAALLLLSDFGYLKRNTLDEWCLTKKSNEMFENPWLKEYILLWGEQLLPAFSSMPLVRNDTRGSFEIAHGETVWEYYRHNPDANKRFVEYMDKVSQYHCMTNAIADALQLENYQYVADIGGASSALMTSILRRYPHLNGIVLDQPHLESFANTRIAEAKLQNRCRFIGGNFLAGPLPADAEIYLLKHVLHDWDDLNATEILKNICCAMQISQKNNGKAKLYLIEGLLDEKNREKFWLKPRNLEQVLWSSGKVRSYDELSELLAKAGLKIISVQDTPISWDCAVIETVLA